jgi:phosphatidylglycerol:prolipoprotein diacylglycerol transferase
MPEHGGQLRLGFPSSHTTMVFAGSWVGLGVGNLAADLVGMDSARVMLAQLLLLIVGLAGARFLHLLVYARFYRQHPTRVWDRSRGGASQLGGLVLVLPVSFLVLHWLSLPLGKFWDLSAFSLLIGFAIGKFGCLMHGCCGGWTASCTKASPASSPPGFVFQAMPLQVIESSLALGVLTVAVALWIHQPPPGAVFLIALALFASGRFALQGRRRHQDVVGSVNVQRLLAGALALCSLAGLISIAASSALSD